MSYRGDREPQPSDGPDYRADHQYWKERQVPDRTAYFQIEARNAVIAAENRAKVMEALREVIDKAQMETVRSLPDALIGVFRPLVLKYPEVFGFTWGYEGLEEL